MDIQYITPQKAKLITASNRLLNLGLAYINTYGKCGNKKNTLLRCEYAIKSGLHRGYYCPSPVVDILVGNVKRGRLKHAVKDTEWSNITHCYHFDNSGKMVYSEQFLQGILLCTEYLIYSGNTVYGIGIDPRGRLLSVSEEQYVERQIQSYLYASFAVVNAKTICYDIKYETYDNDSFGLHSVQIETFIPESLFYQHDSFVFSRESGFLVSYQQKTTADASSQYELTYTTRIRRKADASFPTF